MDGSEEAPQTEEESLMSLARNLAYDDVPEPIRQSIIAQRLRNPSTGVKGVLADYRADQQLAAAQRESKIQYREAVLHRMAAGATTTLSIQSSQMPLQPQAVEDIEVDEDEDFDAEFLREFRSKRLQGLTLTAYFTLPFSHDSFVLRDENDKSAPKFRPVHRYSFAGAFSSGS